MRTICLGAFVAILSLASGCSTPVPLDKEVSDAFLVEAAEVDDVCYSYEFSEVYRGDHELKRVAIVSCFEGFQLINESKNPIRGLPAAVCKGLALGLNKRGLTVALPAPAVSALGLEVMQEKAAQMGSLTAQLSARNKDQEAVASVGIRAYEGGPALGQIGSPGGVAHMPGSRSLQGGIGGTIFANLQTADDEIAALARELEVDALLFVSCQSDEVEAHFVVPFAKLRVAGGSERTYPLDMNHVRKIHIDFSGGDGSGAAYEAMGETLARRIRLWYPGSGS